MIEVSLVKRLASAAGYMDLDLQFQMERGQILALYGPSGKHLH